MKRTKMPDRILAKLMPKWFQGEKVQLKVYPDRVFEVLETYKPPAPGMSWQYRLVCPHIKNDFEAQSTCHLNPHAGNELAADICYYCGDYRKATCQIKKPLFVEELLYQTSDMLDYDVKVFKNNEIIFRIWKPEVEETELKEITKNYDEDEEEKPTSITDVEAIFPWDCGDNNPNTCSCIGYFGSGAGDYRGMIERTRPVYMEDWETVIDFAESIADRGSGFSEDTCRNLKVVRHKAGYQESNRRYGRLKQLKY